MYWIIEHLEAQAESGKLALSYLISKADEQNMPLEEVETIREKITELKEAAKILKEHIQNKKP